MKDLDKALSLEVRTKKIKDAIRNYALITNYMERFNNPQYATTYEKKNLLEIKKAVDYYVDLIIKYDLTQQGKGE
jgi:hypothetical protein